MTLVKMLNKIKQNNSSSLAVFDNETGSSKNIPISHFVTPSIFCTKNSEYGVVIKVKGLSFEVAAISEINYLLSNLAFMLRSLEDQFALYVTVHRQREIIHLEGNYPDGFAKDFAKNYNNKFEHKDLFSNNIYVSLMIKAGSTKIKRGLNLLQKLSHKKVESEFKIWHETQLKKLNNQLTNVLNALAEYSPQLLSFIKDENGSCYSEVLSFLSIIINGEPNKLLYPYEDIATFIPSKRLFFGKNTIHFQGHLQKEDKFAAILSIKKYYPQQVPGLLNGLLSLPFEYVATHSYLGIDKAQAIEIIRRQEARLIAVNDESKSQVAELNIAADDLASDRINFGYHHNTILVFAKSISDLDEIVAKAEKMYADIGIVVVRETLNLESAFWAQIPGNFSMIRRSSLISSNNFACFCSLHNYYSGYKDQNHLGSALMLAETRSHTPFYLNLHEKASGRKNDLSKGHTTMIGNSGGGKTVFMMAVNTMFQKYGIRSFIFDRNRGCDIYVRAMNGKYFLLDPNENTGWNPCQLADSEQNRDFLRSFIKMLITRPDITLTSRDENQISEVVDRNYSLPFTKRNLSNAASFFRHDFIGLDALSKWLRLPDRTGKSGEYAYLFDNPTDTLNFDNNTIGFDMTYLLGADGERKKDILAPVMMYLFHKIQLGMDGTLTGVFLDEGWQFLNHPFWIERLSEYYVTWRKLNGFLFFATQLPDKVAKSQLSSELIQGSATNIFLPNPQAEEKDYIDSFKLTKAEFNFIKTANPQSRYFLLKQGHDAAIIKLDLGNMDKYLAVLSGNKETVSLCDSLRSNLGDNANLWLPQFYERYSKL